jgi:hypothetical protein
MEEDDRRITRKEISKKKRIITKNKRTTDLTDSHLVTSIKMTMNNNDRIKGKK